MGGGHVRLATASRDPNGVCQTPTPDGSSDSEDINHGKPDPEGYMLAADLLGVRAENCLVLKDSCTGLEAGRAAGMTLLAVTTTHSIADLNCDWCVSDLHPLEDLAED
jgi:mannitol-1-/sugar-/sorbitol-6-phosphatase